VARLQRRASAGSHQGIPIARAALWRPERTSSRQLKLDEESPYRGGAGAGGVADFV
jgi:hypothetical protein